MFLSISYTNDFKRELKEKRPELTNKVPFELEGFRRPKWTFLIGNIVRMVHEPKKVLVITGK